MSSDGADSGTPNADGQRMKGHGAMRLETEAGTVIEEPSDEKIRDVLAHLDGSAPGNSFAILTRSDEPIEYLQTGGGPNTFLVEYRENDRQFRGADENLPYETTAAMLTSYRRGDDAWRSMVAWVDVTEEVLGRPARRRPPIYSALLLIAFLALLATLFVLTRWVNLGR
jgi:hypothetical protein